MNTQVERTADALAFWLVTTRKGCQVHDDPSECELPVQAAHVLSKQSLKRHGHEDKVWDVRNGIGACYRAHRRSDAGLERFPLEKLSPEFWKFADEVGLRYLAERQYAKGVSS